MAQENRLTIHGVEKKLLLKVKAKIPGYSDLDLVDIAHLGLKDWAMHKLRSNDTPSENNEWRNRELYSRPADSLEV